MTLQYKQSNLQNKLDLIPWVYHETIPVITNNDGDGIMSLLFLFNHPFTKDKTNMKGLYDLSKLYLDKRTDQYYIKDMIGIDLEMQIEGMHCLGHHMNVSYNTKCRNANDLFNISDNALLNFYKKCPLNTLILLYWLFGEKPKNDREIAFLVYWDSVIYNYETYTQNVTKWLKVLNMPELLDALENRIDVIYDIIAKEILPFTKGFQTGRELSGLPQCNITPIYDFNTKTFSFKQDDSNKSLTRILSLAESLMKWDTTKFLSTFSYRANYETTTFQIEGNFDEFKKRLDKVKHNFVSSAMTSKQNFRVTTTKSINEEAKECGLIISTNGCYQIKVT